MKVHIRIVQVNVPQLIQGSIKNLKISVSPSNVGVYYQLFGTTTLTSTETWNLNINNPSTESLRFILAENQQFLFDFSFPLSSLPPNRLISNTYNLGFEPTTNTPMSMSLQIHTNYNNSLPFIPNQEEFPIQNINTTQTQRSGSFSSGNNSTNSSNSNLIDLDSPVFPRNSSDNPIPPNNVPPRPPSQSDMKSADKPQNLTRRPRTSFAQLPPSDRDSQIFNTSQSSQQVELFTPSGGNKAPLNFRSKKTKSIGMFSKKLETELPLSNGGPNTDDVFGAPSEMPPEEMFAPPNIPNGLPLILVSNNPFAQFPLLSSENPFMNLPELPEGFNPFMTNVVVPIEPYLSKKKKHHKDKDKEYKEHKHHKKDENPSNGSQPKKFFDEMEWDDSQDSPTKHLNSFAPMPVNASSATDIPDDNDDNDIGGVQQQGIVAKGGKFSKFN